MARFRERAYAVDLRALALWRMGLGSIVMVDILLRLRDLVAFYGDGGLYPRSLILEQFPPSPVYLLFLSTGSSFGLGLLFALWFLAALFFTLGYRTRLCGFLVWYLTASIQLRNPLITDGGDDLLRLLLFWTPFLPLGARWSIDELRKRGWKGLPTLYRSVATFALHLQYGMLYFFAAHLKTGEDWRTTGHALYYTLSIDQFVTSYGVKLLEYPRLLEGLSLSIVWLEYGLGLLILLPLSGWARYGFLVGAFALHLGIASTLKLGIFMPIVLVGLSVFLPTELLDRIFGREVRYGTVEGGDEPPVGYRLSWPIKAGLSFCVFAIAVMNYNSIEWGHRLPGWTMTFSQWTYLNQHWHFFAPYPFREDGWFTLEREGADGSLEDVGFHGVEPGVKPESVASDFPNHRWRRWLQNLVQIDTPDQTLWRRSTTIYLAERWRERTGVQEPGSFHLVYYLERTPPPGGTTEVERFVLWTYRPGTGAAPRLRAIPIDELAPEIRGQLAPRPEPGL